MLTTMRRYIVLCQPEGLSPTMLEHLVGQLSNPCDALNAVLGSNGGRRQRRSTAVLAPKPRRLGNGVVQRAVLAIMQDGGSRFVREVHVAVEKRLCQSVSVHSVNWCLSAGAKKERCGSSESRAVCTACGRALDAA